MNIIEFFQHEQRRLHEWMREAVRDLTLQEWNTVPVGTGNSIAFLFWHAVRTEDNILRFILQGRPPIWTEENWHARLGLPERVQGTRMSTTDAQALYLADAALFMTYVERVWREYEAYLANITDGGVELAKRMVTIKPLGEMSCTQAIGQVCISHLYTHYGEIALLRGLFHKQGMVL